MKPEDFAAIGIDSTKRAENLAVADYEAITRHLAGLQRPE
jgi:16S rRNA (adenine1518-N6/adenine1519-N6)-dimethyltransferase